MNKNFDDFIEKLYESELKESLPEKENIIRFASEFLMNMKIEYEINDDIIENYSDKNHWLIRVNNGVNFRNSKYPFWGLISKWMGDVKKFNKGDVLWFITPQEYGGIILGLAEFTEFFDRNDEPLIPINTYSNKEQNWEGDDDWSIQVHYENLYDIEKKNIKISIQCAGSVLDYESFKHKGIPDLRKHYSNFKFYSEPTKFK